MQRERLRAAVAVAHVVPCAKLNLDLDGRPPVVVSHEVGADLNPCQVRRALIAEASCPDVDVSQYIESAELHGAVMELGGGISLVRRQDYQGRVLTSLLGPQEAKSITDAEVRGLPVTSTVIGDFDLGVTVIQLTCPLDVSTHTLHAATLAVASQLMVEEVERRPFAPIHRGHA